ncbi:MAG: putative repeat protein (TIGR01451 family) [Hyphomicrobiaceae bacterium]
MTPGLTYLAVQPPLGSFPPGQPPIDIDPTPGNKTADEPTDVVIGGDPALQIVKRDSPDSVEPGGTLTYTLDYSNISLLSIDDVVIEEAYDAATSFVTAVPFPDVGNSQWNIGTLLPRQTGTITITVLVDGAASDGDVLVNSVSMSGDGVPPATDDEETTVSEPGPDTALLRVTKSVNPLIAASSGLLTYTFTVFNEGQAMSYDTIVTDDLPAGTTYSNANPQPDSVAGSLLQWAVGDLAPGAGATFTVYALTDATLPAGTLIENCTVANGTSGPGTIDNAGLSAEGCAVSSSSGPGTDCALVMKNRSVGVPVPGGDIVYRCLWCDPCSDASTVLISDFIPEGTTLVSFSTKDVDATSTADGNVEFSIAQLPAGRAGLAHIRVRINDDVVPGTAITNTITMSDAALRQQSGTDVLIVRAGKKDIRENGFLRVTGPKRVPDGGKVSYKAKYKHVEVGATITMVLSEQINPVFIFPPADQIDGNVVTWENIRRSSGTVRVKGEVILTESNAVGAILSAEVLATTPSQLQFNSGSDTAITNGPAAVAAGNTVSKKKLTVSVNAPRFLRAGLQTSISLRYRNLQGTGNAQMNLPVGLTYVSSIPEPTLIEGSIFTWTNLNRLSGSAKVRVLVDEALDPNTILTIGASITDDVGAAGTESIVTTR